MRGRTRRLGIQMPEEEVASCTEMYGYIICVISPGLVPSGSAGTSYPIKHRRWGYAGGLHIAIHQATDQLLEQLTPLAARASSLGISGERGGQSNMCVTMCVCGWSGEEAPFRTWAIGNHVFQCLIRKFSCKVGKICDRY